MRVTEESEYQIILIIPDPRITDFESTFSRLHSKWHFESTFSKWHFNILKVLFEDGGSRMSNVFVQCAHAEDVLI